MTEDTKLILKELNDIKVELHSIKRIIDRDAALTPEENERLRESLDDFKKGKTLSLEDFEKEMTMNAD